MKRFTRLALAAGLALVSALALSGLGMGGVLSRASPSTSLSGTLPGKLTAILLGHVQTAAMTIPPRRTRSTRRSVTG